MSEILSTLIDSLKDSLLDTLKIAPFLFVIYLLMEYIEHKADDRTKNFIAKSGRFGPVLGGLLGAIPQCGFSAACSGLFAGGVISLGTLLAVFISTSDEMLPIMLTGGISPVRVLKIIGFKAVIGILIGLLADVFVPFKQDKENKSIHDMCEHDHCHCEEGVLRAALHHFAEIITYIFVFTLVLNVIIGFTGEENIESLFVSVPVVGHLIAAVIGLIPNCASSIIITNLFLSGVISSGIMMSGLLVGAGVGLAVLFRTNRNTKQNIMIGCTLFIIGTVLGILIDALQITF